MDYNKMVKEILSNIGGEENINTVSHCMTRLRLVLKDEKQVNKDAVEKINGVLGSTFGAGQYQIVLGKNLDGAYSELMKNYNVEGNNESNNTNKQKEKLTLKSVGKAIVDYMSGSVSPVITGLVAGGVLKLVLYIATLINSEVAANSTYNFISIIANVPFYFMPVLVAYGASNKLGCNPVLPIILACTLIDPSYLALEGEQTLFGIGVPLLKYSSTVIPTMLSTLAVYYIEKFFNKIIPGILKNVLALPLTFLVSYTLTILVLAPLGNYVGNYVVNALVWLDSVAAPLALGVLTAALPFMVMAGVHTLVAPFMLENFSSLGYDSLFRPGLLLQLLAVGGASIGTAFKQKDKEQRVDLISIGVESILAGISEPGIFGVIMKYSSAMIGCTIGAFVGGVTGGLLGIKAYVMTKNTILSLPTFQDTIVGAAIACGVTFIVSAVVSFILYKDKKEDEIIENAIITPVVKGERISLEDVNDEVFSTKTMGDGVAYIPESNEIYAPFSGTIVTVFPTKHAYGLRRDDGVEAIIHIGLDTVSCNGEYFESFVKDNQRVKAGDVIAKADFKSLREKGYDVTTMLVFPELKDKTIHYSDDKEIVSIA